MTTAINSEQLAPITGSNTVNMLFAQFGEVMIPLEKVRAHYFRNLNTRSFKAAIRDGSISLTISRLHASNKAPEFISIYELATLFENADSANDPLLNDADIGK